MSLRLKTTGNWNKTYDYLKKLHSFQFTKSLDSIGKKGVEALMAATPKSTGLAASSWGYEIKENGSDFSIEWHNYDIENGLSVIVLIESGHGLSNGGYIPPRPFVDETLSPLYEECARVLWEEVSKL